MVDELEQNEKNIKESGNQNQALKNLAQPSVEALHSLSSFGISVKDTKIPSDKSGANWEEPKPEKRYVTYQEVLNDYRW